MKSGVLPSVAAWFTFAFASRSSRTTPKLSRNEERGLAAFLLISAMLVPSFPMLPPSLLLLWSLGCVRALDGSAHALLARVP